MPEFNSGAIDKVRIPDGRSRIQDGRSRIQSGGMNIQKMPAYNAGEMDGEIDREKDGEKNGEEDRRNTGENRTYTGNREQGTENPPLYGRTGEFSI